MNSHAPIVLLPLLFKYRSFVGRFAFRIAFALIFLLSIILSAAGKVSAETSVQFRLVHRFAIIVTVKINDSGSYDFLLDTGTNTSMIRKELADRHSLRVVDQACLHTIAGTQMVPRGYLDRVSLGGHTVSNLEMLAANIPGARTLDSNVAGILGLNFLRHFNFTIDYKARTIVFDDETGKPQIRGLRHAIENADGVYVVKASASSCNSTLKNGSGFWRRKCDLFSSTPQYLFGYSGQNDMSWTTVFTNAGSQKLFTGRLRLLKIGDSELTNVTAMITSIDQHGDSQAIDGLLPTCLFHRVYFNFANGYVIFEPER